MSITRYCTNADVRHILGDEAVNLRLDDDPEADGYLMDEAATEVNEYCQLKYDPAVLATSAWVQKKAAVIYAMLLCERRGNPAPPGVARQYTKAIQSLEKVLAGKMRIPDIATRKRSAPVLSSPRVAMWPRPRVVIDKSSSTGNVQGYTQQTDRFDGYVPDYSI